MVKKESIVVESEFKVSLQDDNLKIKYLLSQLSDPSHPYSRFTAGIIIQELYILQNQLFLIGNVQQLRDNFDIDIVEELEKFRNTYYSSNLMKLVIFTDTEIESVEEFIQPFQDITNIIADKPSFSQFHKPIKHAKKIVKLKTLDENEVFYMVYQVDIDKSQYRKRPIEYITYFLNNQMEGGLKYYLKEKLDLIIDLEIGSILDQQNYSIFFIKFQIQDKKITQYQKVANAVNNYLEFIKRDGLEESIYNERALIANLTFSYNAQTTMYEENVSNYAWNLNEYDYKEVFAADSTWSETLDKNYVHSVINQMQNFDNIILIVGSSNFSNEKMSSNTEDGDEIINEVQIRSIEKGEKNLIETISQTKNEDDKGELVEKIDKEDEYLNNDQFDNEFPLYDIQYTEKQLNKNQIDQMTNINEDIIKFFKVEQKNKYIPSSIDLENICEQNNMQIQQENIDLSAYNIPKTDSGVCKYSPYENPIRQFTNFKFKDFINESQIICKNEEYIDIYQKYPSLIKHEHGIEGWYKFDQFYQVPQVVGYFNILFEDRFEKPKDVVAGMVISKIYQKNIATTLCDAIDAGYLIEVTPQYSSLTVKVVGWSESFSEVVTQLFQIWKKVEFSEEEYDNALEEVQNEIDNFKQWNTKDQGQKYFLQKIMIEEFIDPKTILTELEKITYEEVVKQKQSERSNSKLMSMVIGNIQAKQVQELMNTIDTQISFSSNLQQYRNVYGVFEIDSPYYVKYSIHIISQRIKKPLNNISQLTFNRVKTIGPSQDLNRSVVSFYQIGKRDATSICEGRILVKLLKQFIHTYLINEKQYVYSVTIELVNYGSVDGILISVSGGNVDVNEMQKHLNQSIETFSQKLSLILGSEFEDIKQSELRDLNSNQATLKEKAESLWKQLNYFNYVFDEQEILISMLMSTSKEDIIKLFESTFYKSPKLVSILVHNSKDSIKKNISKSNKGNEIKIITSIFKQMNNRNFNKFSGDIL